MWPGALCSCVYALDYLDMPTMSLNCPILSLFWAPSSLLGHCHRSHSQQRAAVRDGGGRGERGAVIVSWELGQCQLCRKRSKRKVKNSFPVWIPGPSTCPCHVPARCSMYASLQHCEETARSGAACQHTLLALGLACRQPCLLARRRAAPPAQSAHPLTHVHWDVTADVASWLGTPCLWQVARCL